MSEDTRTLVLVHLGMANTPVGPHRPGTYVCGYVNGTQEEADGYLNTCKKMKTNALIRNAFLVQIGIEFEPQVQRDSDGRPVRGQDGQLISTGHMGIKQGFALLPLTNMDATNGSDYSVEAIYWIFPKGSMVQDLESQMKITADNLLHSRTGITTHPAGLPQGMRPPRA